MPTNWPVKNFTPSRDPTIPKPDQYDDLPKQQLPILCLFWGMGARYNRLRERPDEFRREFGRFVARKGHASTVIKAMADAESLPCSSSPYWFLEEQFEDLTEILCRACDGFGIESQPIYEFYKYPDADLKAAIRAVERLERRLRGEGIDLPAAHPEPENKEHDVRQGEQLARNDTDNKWPPDNGLHFRPLEFGYQGKVYRLTGMPGRLFEAIATAKKSLHHDEIVERVWKPPERTPERGTVRGCLANLRTALRSHGLGVLAKRIAVKDDYWSFLD